MTLCPGAILKKKKKRKYAVVESEQDEDDVSQMNVEAVLASLKGAGAEKLGQYLSNMKALASAGPQISLSVSATSCPYYLLGRCCLVCTTRLTLTDITLNTNLIQLNVTATVLLSALFLPAQHHADLSSPPPHGTVFDYSTLKGIGSWLGMSPRQRGS